MFGVRTSLVGTTKQYGCPDCTGTGVRDPPGLCVPAPCEGADFRWEEGDIVQILGAEPYYNHSFVHTEEPVQLLYLAEGNNFVVRVTNIAPPPDFICERDGFPATIKIRQGISA